MAKSLDELQADYERLLVDVRATAASIARLPQNAPARLAFTQDAEALANELLSLFDDLEDMSEDIEQSRSNALGR